MTTQSTQYNTQQAPYDELRKTSIAIIERVNIRSIVIPFIKDAQVLDLACGSGFYSHAFLKCVIQMGKRVTRPCVCHVKFHPAYANLLVSETC